MNFLTNRGMCAKKRGSEVTGQQADARVFDTAARPCGRRDNRRAILRTFALILSFCTLWLTVLPVSAEAETDRYRVIPMTVAGRVMTLGNEPSPSRLINDTTYVPLRAFCETIDPGCKIGWNQSSLTATVDTTYGYRITVPQGKSYIEVGTRVFYTVEPILNLEGRLYLPVRPLAKAFGAEVIWNAQTYSVRVESPHAIYCAADSYNADDLYWLSKIISAEAAGQPFEGQMAVGNVVLNRRALPSYPDTIWGVIFDRKFGTQFTPVANGTIYRDPNASSVRAAKACLEGYTVSDKILFFCNPALSTTTWIMDNRPWAFTIAQHMFFE